jgi:hypothetical protein
MIAGKCMIAAGGGGGVNGDLDGKDPGMTLAIAWGLYLVLLVVLGVLLLRGTSDSTSER